MSDAGKIIALAKAVAKVDPASIEQSVSDWLDDHPEATTTVEDGSITKAKLNESLQGTVDDVDELKSALSSTTGIIENDILPSVISSLALEKGAFNSSSGAKTSVNNRSRTIDYIPDVISKLVPKDLEDIPSGGETGILLYAWNSSDTYVGFWGGIESGFVTSGSVYLDTVDMTYFHQNYPSYKFKAVLQTTNDNVTLRRIFAYVTDMPKSIEKIEQYIGGIEIELEDGTFNSSTGAESTSSNRMRSKGYISSNIGYLMITDSIAYPYGILLYAWDGSDNYVGFWGGSGFVTSGSVYLENIDLTSFRTIYPTYKYRIVVGKSSDKIGVVTGYADSSLVTRTSRLEEKAQTFETNEENQNYLMSYGQGGFSVSSNGTVTISSNSARIYTKTNIPSRTKTIVANSGYCFLLYAMTEDWKTAGSYKNGGFSISGSSELLTSFDLSGYNYSGYKLVIRTTNGTDSVSPSDGKSAIALYPFSLADLYGNDTADISMDEDKNVCLCGIKTDIIDNAIPFHKGFLFHSFKTDSNNKLWYGNSFDDIKLVGMFPTDPRQLRFAISPKDGRIIATNRDTRSGIWVWNGTTSVKLESFTTQPMAWLYNSGVDFVNSGNDEYCVFAEYYGNSISSSTELYVWRGKYPYTSAENWEIVLTQTGADITHFHMVRRDPWTNVLYLTSGDDSAKCKWWYSTDAGATWTLLTTGSTSGYEDHVCRTINFIFTEDYIYWATDKGTNHCLNKAERDTNGILDPTTRVKMCDLPSSYATNSLCYVESPKGLFMYDRVDIGYDSAYGDPVTMKFYDLNDNTLKDIVTMPLASNTWGGCRGKCYVNYTNSVQLFPAMGFSPDTPCIFDIVTDDLTKIGTIGFDPGCKRFFTVNRKE